MSCPGPVRADGRKLPRRHDASVIPQNRVHEGAMTMEKIAMNFPTTTSVPERSDTGRLSLADLAVSGRERDRWQQRVLDAERAGYDRGRRDGVAAGYRRGREDEAAAWKAALAPAGEQIRRLAAGPGLAELEEARWGPGGRAHFADPRPGDYRGEETHEPSA